ncbi:hypothetical protein LIPSTDRAFT_73530 [Lipomyces starkeyi NRRL Y-11557]|uniref:Uncharacterized protein n=1 Tax=Lipomyces starkeyi NRRL Y-11557 TaxID=675824 RepID=A0A1E3Q3P6_LIPST|nr:hypothetical protein LIPSTDRAFT_73530 [Lipomyces starkeyi NRRL Y-11557]
MSDIDRRTSSVMVPCVQYQVRRVYPWESLYAVLGAWCNSCKQIQSRRGTFDRKERLKKHKAGNQNEARHRDIRMQSEHVVSCQVPGA